MDAAHRRRLDGDTALQVGFALLGLALSVLAWWPLLTAFVPAG